MDQISVTTYPVGAQQSIAASLTATFPNVGLIEHQPGFAPVRRRTLMAAVNTLAKTLGLRPASVMVLDALLSCLPCQDGKTGADQPITPLTLLTVYASNETLCFRAKGIPERQLRRHLDRLEAVGLIARRDSSNGKRFPIQRGGKVVGAYGIDLSPLLARSAALLVAAERHRDEAMELRGLRAMILRLRLDCLTRHLSGESLSFVEAVQTVLRRATLTLTQARALLAKLSDILRATSAHDDAIPLAAVNAPAARVADGCDTPAATDQQDAAPRTADVEEARSPSAPSTETGELTVTDGRNDRHKKTPKSDSKKMAARPASGVWQSLRCLPSFYLEEPESDHDLRRILFETGAMLRIGQNSIAEAIAKIGLEETLTIIDRIADRPDEIAKPEAYLLHTVTTICRSMVGHGHESGTLRTAPRDARAPAAREAGAARHGSARAGSVPAAL